MKCLKKKYKHLFIISCACLLPPTLLQLLCDLSLSTSHMFTYLTAIGPKLLLFCTTEILTLLQFITGRFRRYKRIILIQPDLFTQIRFVMNADVKQYTVFTQHKAKKYEVN